MNENVSTAPISPFETSMYLYEQPELLTSHHHGKLGLSRVERPFDFTRSVQAIPIAITEVRHAQKHYPIVFSDLENPALLAVLGIGNENLFLDADGNWDIYSYIPAYIRCHPFALATDPSGHSVGVIDRAAACVSDSPELPFFAGKHLIAEIQARLNICAEFTAHREHTKVFCDRVKDLGLLGPQQVTHQAATSEDKKVLASFYSVETDRLKALDNDALQAIHSDGSLAAIYGHLFSQDNWQNLMTRKERREGKQIDPATQTSSLGEAHEN